MLFMLRAKLHNVKVTDKKLYYNGSITIGEELLKKAGFLEGEKVEIYNMNNGKRFSTYVIKGRGSEIVLNGAAARMGEIGDALIIASYALMTEKEAKRHKPKVVKF